MKTFLIFFIINYSTTLLASTSFYEVFKRAKSNFQLGEVESAKRLFLKLIEDKKLEDLSKIQKKAIHYSYFRLAQLEREHAQRDLWLEKAAHWLPEEYPDTDLFPPPLVEEYFKIVNFSKKQKPKKVVSQQNIKEKKYDLNPQPEVQTYIQKAPPLSGAPSIFKNKWLWLGVGVLAGTIIYNENQRDKKSHKVIYVPQKEGF